MSKMFNELNLKDELAGTITRCHGKYSPCQGVREPLSVLIYRGFLPINLQLTRASKTAIPLRDSYEPLLPHIYNIIGITE